MSESDWRTGVVAGVVTPFDERGRVDAASLSTHFDDLANGGLSGVVVNADTGEGLHLDPDERDLVLRAAVREIGDRVAVLDALIANHTKAAVEAARRSEGNGAVALQVFPPPAFLGTPLDPAMAAEYYEAVASAVKIPLIIYRPPIGLGYGIDLPVLGRLLGIEAVTAIKESSFDIGVYRETADLVRRSRPGVALMSGADTFVVDSIRIGADGLMLAVAGFAPARWVHLLHAERSENPVDGRFLRDGLAEVARAAFASPFRDFRARLKVMLVAASVIANDTVRPPLLPIQQAEKAAIRDLLQDFDLVPGGASP